MFLSVADVLLVFNFKCSYFTNKGICQFLIMIWCVHRLWFIENLSSRTGCEVFNDHEQCGADGWVEWIVVGKLGHRDPSGSVDLKSIPPLSKIELHKLINVFYLIICFQMKDSWEFDINVHAKAYLFSEITDKLKAIIWYNEIRSTVFLIEFNESDVVYTDSINFLYKHEHGIFWKAVHNNHHIDTDFFMSVNEWR